MIILKFCLVLVLRDYLRGLKGFQTYFSGVCAVRHEDRSGSFAAGVAVADDVRDGRPC